MATRPVAAALLAVATLLALSAVGTLPLAAQEDVRATRTPRPTPSATPGCVVTATHKADPAQLAVGQEMTVTVRLRTACRFEPYPLHVVLLFEATSEVDRDLIDRSLTSLDQLAAAILEPDNPHNQVGVVGYGDRRNLRCRLTADPTAVETCRRRLRVLANRRGDERGENVLARAMSDATVELRRGRTGYQPGQVRDVMMVFSTGPAPDPCQSALVASRRAKADHVLVASVCMGAGCDAACVRQLASSPRYFFQIDNVAGLIASFTRIRDEALYLLLKQLTLTYAPADGLRLVPGGVEPAATVLPDGSRIDWQWQGVPRDGVTATLRLLPSAAGRIPLAREAGGTWLDNKNRPGTYVVPTAEVEVLAPVIPR